MTASEQDLYDRQLARALNLHQCTASADAFDNATKQIKRIEKRLSSLLVNTIRDLRSDLVELGQKLASAGKKISALIFLPSDMIVMENDAPASQNNNLSFMPILIKRTESYAPPSLPISMAVCDDESINRLTLALKHDLEHQLEWFQKFGRDGGLLTALVKEPAKSKSRHLSIVSANNNSSKAA